MSRERKTLVVTSTFPQHEGDFRGAFLRRHWEQQLSPEHEVRVLAPRTRWTKGALESPLQVTRFPYAPTPFSSLTGRYGILENLRESPARLALVGPYLAALDAALREQLRQYEPDHVVAHFFLPAGAVVARACRGRVPYSLYGHGTDVDILLRTPKALRQRVERAFVAADLIHLPSRTKLERVAEWLGWSMERCEEAGFRVEMMSHAIGPLVTSRTPRASGDHILFLGRLIKQKGVDTLLRALARCNRPPPLVIAGDGPHRKALVALSRSLDLDARFVGWVAGEQKQALLSAARLVVVPSRELGGLGEGAPLVIAEAHAAGRSIIASDVGGVRELVEHLGSDAQLVPPEDPLALARAITRALNGDAQALRAV